MEVRSAVPGEPITISAIAPSSLPDSLRLRLIDGEQTAQSIYDAQMEPCRATR